MGCPFFLISFYFSLKYMYKAYSLIAGIIIIYVHSRVQQKKNIIIIIVNWLMEEKIFQMKINYVLQINTFHVLKQLICYPVYLAIPLITQLVVRGSKANGSHETETVGDEFDTADLTSTIKRRIKNPTLYCLFDYCCSPFTPLWNSKPNDII